MKMRQVNSWMWLIGASTLIAGCAIDGDFKTGRTSDQPLVLTASTPLSTEGILDYGAVVFAENPTTLMETNDLTCHNIGGDDSAGDLNHNIFQIGDGVNRSSE